MSGRRVSIRVKIVSVILAALAASVAVSLVFVLGNTRENLLGASRRALTVNNGILNTVIRNLMLAGEAPVAVQTLAGLKTLEEFEELAIYRADGSTAFNDYATIDSVNAFQDRVTFSRTDRTERLVLGNPDFRAVLESNTPRSREDPAARTMEYYFPILNYAQCRACHGPSPYVRGVAYYRISTANAYERVGAAGTFLASFLGAMGVAIAALLIFLMQRIVVRPVLAIGATVAEVGAGNLDVSIDLASRDELGTLALKINDMIEGLKLRNRLMLENERIEARNRENRKYLDNIGQGLLLIGDDYRIRDQYSAFLTRLFDREEPAGMPFVDFIFPDPAAVGEREELAGFLSLAFHNTLTEMEMIQAANPLRDKVLRAGAGGRGGREIVVDVGFARIMDGERVESLMAIFEDRTQITAAREELAAERERRDSELEEVAAILKAGPGAFAEFTAEASRGLAELRARRGRLGDRSVVDALFRNFHSLKGSARYLELRGFERQAHALEGILAAIRDGAGPEGRREELEAAAGRLEAEIAGISAIRERFSAFVPAMAGAKGAEDAETVLSRLASMASGIAEELGKKVDVELVNEVGSLPRPAALRNALVHLVRNALDHGLEEGLERVAAGKDEEGHLAIRLLRGAPGELRVEVEDDGRGLDFEAIRRKAEEKGLIPAGGTVDRTRLLHLIFRPDFSSRDEASPLSGRGVGLDAVAEAVKAAGGSISVRTVPNGGTRFTLRLPLEEAP